ncbi:hypothetical protein QCA50_013351 [Cerrena zonata]|uniref:Bromo domain-containing protein n=1 Tax=Cerrena zonata TaxID=2478898 RepID=A0AAW0G1T7_9APHY
MLMNHFKAHIRQTYPTINRFLTYADNYAVGYFKKQGFTKEVTLDPSLWIGYIKDYDGGTIMECTMLPKVDYLRIKDIIHAQREAVIDKITEKSTSHVVYPGLRWWKKGRTGPIDPEHVPGLRELGWSPAVAALTKRPDPHDGERVTMKRLLAELERHPKSWPFMQPVNPDEVPDYYNHIQKPMDFSTMEHKIETNQYTTLDGFITDAKLIFSNCKWYNGPDTVYHKAAITMEKFFKEQLSLLKGTGKRKREN